MNRSPLHVVIGASGSVGAALVRELRRRKAKVRAVSRHLPDVLPDDTEWVEGDVASHGDRERIFEGAAVVYLAAQPFYTRWVSDFPLMVEGAIAGAAGVDAVLVHADNLYMYGPHDGALTEQTPERATGRKGMLRARIAARILSAHRSSEVRATIGRSADYFGPGVGGSVTGDALFLDVLAERRAMWLASLDMPHALSYIDDVARALVTLGTRPESLGEVWHLPVEPALTGREFLTGVFEAAGRPPRIGVHSRLAISFVSLFSTFIREVKETLYQWDRPFLVDDSKFRRAFGPFETTPVPEAVRRTVEWYETEFAAAGEQARDHRP
jgi:nucleoside-diphosphate-sugar epimerase